MEDLMLPAEQHWLGTVGDTCTERNTWNHDWRPAQWAKVNEITRPRSVLEVGCSRGLQLDEWKRLGIPGYGVDLNYAGVKIASQRHPVCQAVGRMLPFRSHQFDLVYTSGVLMHVPPQALDMTTLEMARCAIRWVVAVELDRGLEKRPTPRAFYEVPEMVFLHEIYQAFRGWGMGLHTMWPIPEYPGLHVWIFSH